MRAITVHTQYIPCELIGINQIFKLKECKVFPDDLYPLLSPFPF